MKEPVPIGSEGFLTSALMLHILCRNLFVQASLKFEQKLLPVQTLLI